MGADLLGDSSATDSMLKYHKDVVAADRLVWGSSREKPFLRFVFSPVLSQGIQQNRGQHHNPIFLPFPLMDGNGQAFRVDVADSQASDLGAPQAGGINGHQQGAAFEMLRCGQAAVAVVLLKEPSSIQGLSRDPVQQASGRVGIKGPPHPDTLVNLHERGHGFDAIP